MLLFTLRVRDARYSDHIAECAEKDMTGEKCVVRVIGLGKRILVKTASLEPLSAEGITNECSICLEPLCKKDKKLMCGHSLHVACLEKARQQSHILQCPLCRDSSGRGKDFQVNYIEQPVLDVVASALGVIYLEKSKKRKSGNLDSLSKASSWALRRCALMQGNDKAQRTVIKPLLNAQQVDKMKLKAATGQRIMLTFPMNLAFAIACALPGADWEEECYKYVRTMGEGVLEAYPERLKDMLEMQI